MSRTTGPLLSFSASGQIAKTQVYASWKGISYARRYVIPANPNTAEQQLTRSAFSFVQAVWKYAAGDVVDAFNAYARALPMTGRNAMAKFNVGALREAADIEGFVFSPGAGSGLAAPALDLTPGDGTITAVVTAPDLPTGWTIDKAVAVALLDQDPNTGTDYIMASGTDESDPYSIELSGLTNDAVYVVGAFFVFTRPDGKKAYGTSINDTTTPTAS